METQQTIPSRSESAQSIQETGRTLSPEVEEVLPGMVLAGAAASVALSFLLRVTGRQHDALFVGQWAPTLLLFGLYSGKGRRFGVSSKQRESGEHPVAREVH